MGVGGGGDRSTKKYSRKRKFNEKNSCTPINPKKYLCHGLKKIHTRNLITKKKSCGSKIPPPPSHSFSNGRVPNFHQTNLKAYFKIIIQREVATFLKSQMIVHFVLKTDSFLAKLSENYSWTSIQGTINIVSFSIWLFYRFWEYF